MAHVNLMVDSSKNSVETTEPRPSNAPRLRRLEYVLLGKLAVAGGSMGGSLRVLGLLECMIGF